MTGYYQIEYPKINEIVSIKVVSYDELSGFTVTLEEYNDIEALLPASRLIRGRLRRGKKITSFCKVGDQRLAVVDVIEPGRDGKFNINVGCVGILEEELKKSKEYMDKTNRLISKIKRLARISETEPKEWMRSLMHPLHIKDKCFIEEEETAHTCHLIDCLSTRDGVESVIERSFLSDKLKQALLDNHLTVFGANVVTDSKGFTLVSFKGNGRQHIVDSLQLCLDKWSKTYSDEELYLDTELFNLDFRTIALPKYELVVSAGRLETCKQSIDCVFDELRKKLDSDYFLS